MKNNGEMAADVKWDFLKSYEGLEHVRVISKGNYNSNATPWSAGFSYMNDTIKTDLLVDTSGNHSATANFMWQVAPWLIFGGTKTWKNALDVMNNVKWTCAFAGHFQKELQWGLLLDGQSDTLADTTVKASTMYFNHATANRTVGAEMKYDVVKKAFNCKVGLKLDEGDHTWKLRLHDSGLARAAL